MKFSLISLTQILAISFCLSCNAQPAHEEDKLQYREIGRVEEASAQATETAPRVKSATCQQLIDASAPFVSPEALEAWELYDAKRYVEASKAFDALIAKGAELSIDDRQLAYFLAARSKMAQNRPEDLSQTVDLLKRAFAIDAKLKRVSAVYGTELGYRAERWQDVVDFSQAVTADDNYRSYKGIALTKLGQFDAAIAEFEAVKSYPKNLRLDALQARAHAQEETAQTKGALETYRRIFELDPESPQGLLAQEAIMAQAGRWPQGFVFPRVQSKTDKAQSLRERAAGHFNAHRSESAIQAYTKLLKDDKKNKDTQRVCGDLYAIGRSYVKLRQHSKSIAFFSEGIDGCKKDPELIKFYYTGARAAWNAGETSRAMSWYQAIIDDFPTHSYADDAYHFQAQILLGQGKANEARAKMQAQIAAYPDGDMAKDTYWLLLQELYENGQWLDAIAFVDANHKHAGEDDLYSQGRLRYFQARSYEKVSKNEAASGIYLRLLDEYPLSYYAMLSLGRLEAIAPVQAKLWRDNYRPNVSKPSDAFSHCFEYIGEEKAFGAAKQLLKMGLITDALDEIQGLIESKEAEFSHEAKLARAMLLHKSDRHSEAARLAASLIRPVQDLSHKRYAAWLLAYPMPWRQIVEASAPFGSELFYTTYAIMREESYYNPRAESWANARGLMQIMQPTAESTAKSIGLPKPSANDLFKPETAIPLGAAYISKLNNILVPHPMFVLPGYNAGQGNVGKWLTRFADIDVDLYVEKIPFKEARHYAKRVGTTLWRYRWLYDNELPKNFDPAQRVSKLKKK